MHQQPTFQALQTRDLAFHLDNAKAYADDKMSIHDLFTTVGHVACALGACGLLHAILL